MYLYAIENLSTITNIYIYPGYNNIRPTPYKNDKYYIVTEYINNNSAVRNLLAPPTTSKFFHYRTSHIRLEDQHHFIMLFKIFEHLIYKFYKLFKLHF
jgi:hypothetical protein